MGATRGLLGASGVLRAQGRLGLLSHVVTMQVLDHLALGSWNSATACADEGRRYAEDTGQPIWNTGSLSLDPYLTFGQTFGRSSYGTFNFLAAAGYWFSVDDERTDYTHVHLHLDYDVGNLHRIYPLLELSWLHTTSFGKANEFVGTEGGDLINFGSTSYNGKRDLVYFDVGARYAPVIDAPKDRAMTVLAELERGKLPPSGAEDSE